MLHLIHPPPPGGVFVPRQAPHPGRPTNWRRTAIWAVLLLSLSIWATAIFVIGLGAGWWA